MIHIGLFEGIGGFSLAAQWIGWKTMATSEINPFGQQVLNYYWPDAYHHGDIHTLTYEKINEELTKRFGSEWRTDDIILTGGFPCQPYSQAGKRLGKEDDRHLWPEYLRLIKEIQPSWVVGENVRGLLSWNRGLVFDEIQADLEASDYEVTPYLLPACAVNAPHQRIRIFFVAHSKSKQSERMRSELGEVSRKKQEQLGGNGSRVGSIRNDAIANGERLQDSKLNRSSNQGRKEALGSTTQFHPGNYWRNFPTTEPAIRNGNDGVSSNTYRETISKEHNMDRDIVIKGALDAGRLEVSFETGKVYSRTIRGRKGELVELPGADCNGYRVHNIYFDGVKKQCRAHQIVWIAANGLYDKSYLMIDHINRDKSDNRLSNLRLVDAKGNANNVKRWEGKFSQNEKDLMHELHTIGNMSFRELAEHFECSKSRVQQIVSEHNGIYGITFPKWRNEAIKAMGNAVVPQVVFEIFKAIERYETKTVQSEEDKKN